MIPYERRLQIAELLEKNEVVSLDEFCKSLLKGEGNRR